MWELHEACEPAIVIAVVGVPLTMRSVGARNFRYWNSFSKAWAGGALIGTFALLSAVSAIAILLQRTLTGEASWPSDLAAAAIAHAAARRPAQNGVTDANDKDGSTTTTLLLGYLPTIYEWVGEHVDAAIEQWAFGLDDEALIAVAAQLDNQTSSGSRAMPFAFRVRHRDRLKLLLTVGGSARDEARMDLVFLIIEGHRMYDLPKPPWHRKGDRR